MSKIIAIAIKDLRLLWRDKMALFWVLGLPLIYACFFGSIFSGSGGSSRMPIAVLDQDDSDASRSFVAKLQASEALTVRLISDKAHLAPATSAPGRAGRISQPATPGNANVQAVRRSVLKGHLVAYVVVKHGFGDTQGMFFGKAPPLEIGIDPSRKAESGMLQGLLMEAAFKGMAEQYMSPDKARAQVQRGLDALNGAWALPAPDRDALKTLMASLDKFFTTVDPKVMREGVAFAGGARLPVVEVRRDDDSAEKSPHNSYEVSFPSAIVWGLMACSAAFAISLVRERTSGTLLRLRLAPISHSTVLAGKGLACYATCCVAILLVLALGSVFFRVRIDRPVNLLLAIASASVCFVGIMMLMCTLGKTPQAVGGAGWGFNCVMGMLGGGMVPLIFMPPWMLTASSISPVKWAVVALEGAIWRSFSMGEMAKPCGILIAIGVTGFMAGERVFSRADG